jgi:hypothetical protein
MELRVYRERPASARHAKAAVQALWELLAAPGPAADGALAAAPLAAAPAQASPPRSARSQGQP